MKHKVYMSVVVAVGHRDKESAQFPRHESRHEVCHRAGGAATEGSGGCVTRLTDEGGFIISPVCTLRHTGSALLCVSKHVSMRLTMCRHPSHH